ncbi:hypothetical protein ACFL0P_00800 [Candidatus Omnitrophota bacterium]
MINIVKRPLLLISILAMAMPLYAETDAVSTNGSGFHAETEFLADSGLPQEPLSIHLKKTERYVTFSDWINSANYSFHIDKDKEKQKLREDWNKVLGLDVFYPYFKAEEIKDRVEEKGSTKVLKIKGTRIRGRPRIKKDEAKYIFSIKF